MPKRIHRPRAGLLATALCVVAAAVPGTALANGEGNVRFAKSATSAFDAYTNAPSLDQESWMRAHYARMRTYAPYFDSRLSWFQDAWTYKDAYAIYPSSSAVTDHPDWILHDASGNRLYIQWGCKNGTCPQFAADIGNPAFRQWWIDTARTQLAAGYRGLFVDDVNMQRKVSNGLGQFVAPIDPRTGAEMSEAAWQGYMATFMQQIRAAFPSLEIVHNSLWPVGDGNDALRRQLGAADDVELERGFYDSGITGGSGRYGFDTLLGYIDRRHADGKGVVLDSYATTDTARMYALSTYLLVSNGRDFIANDSGGTPGDWWAGFSAALGNATGARYRWNGLYRRDFDGGMTLVNAPGATTRTVTLPSGYTDLGGASKASVTLGAAAGVVLRKAPAPQVTTVPVVSAKPVTQVVATLTAPAPTQPAPSTAAPATQPSAPATVVVRGKVSGRTKGLVSVTVQRRTARHHWRKARIGSARVRRGGRFRHAIRVPRGHYRVKLAYRRPAARHLSFARVIPG